MNIWSQVTGYKPLPFIPATGLQGTTVGIDVVFLIKNISYQLLVDVCPAEMIQQVITTVDWFLANKKNVILMFDGMIEDCPNNFIVANPMGYGEDVMKAAKFERFFSKQTIETHYSNATLTALFMALTLHYAHAGPQKVTIMRAPYFAWTQLAALLKEGSIDEVMGPYEMFVFTNVHRVIQEVIDDVAFVVSDADLRKFSGTGDTTDVIVINNSTHRYINNQWFQFVLFSPVYSKQGDVITLSRPADVLGPQHFAPSVDLASFFGQNLWTSHPSIIVHMSTGILPMPVVRNIVKGDASDRINISPTFSPDHYERFSTVLSFMQPLITQVVFQVVDRMGVTPRNNSQRPPEISLEEWNLGGFTREHLPHWLHYLSNLGMRCQSGLQDEYNDPITAHFATRLKVLDLMGYFTHAAAGDGPSGLSSFAHALSMVKTPAAASGVLFIESCRTQMLNGDTLLKNHQGQCANPPSDDYSMDAMLCARIMSLSRLRRNADTKFSNQPWVMNIVAFTNLMRITFEVLQQLSLVIGYNTFIGKASLAHKAEPYDPPTAFRHLIFNEPPAPYMGFVAYEIFMYRRRNNGRSIDLPTLKATFPEATHLEEDLREAATFLCAAYKMAEEMSDDESVENEQSVKIKRAYNTCAGEISGIPGLWDGFEVACPDMSGYNRPQHQTQ